ncbi:Enoyl-CoA delta isomerase 3 [Heracleum sosnowskyi]|uniref:Enoyl-CoA delta isomerase 3 n=1 Tax=Heracleum sosnowskyi TaxID=360622 RepID=A0AAD8M0N2_9APIA|nr:Enoyl-CoA delta isomerase 3 [Heracleum sosnowskyi]
MCTLEKRGSTYILTLTGNDDHRLNPSLADSISAALKSLPHLPLLLPLSQPENGKFFSNGGDIAWAQSNKNRIFLMMSKIRSLLTDLMSLPMPTIAAIHGQVYAENRKILLEDVLNELTIAETEESFKRSGL